MFFLALLVALDMLHVDLHFLLAANLDTDFRQSLLVAVYLDLNVCAGYSIF